MPNDLAKTRPEHAMGKPDWAKSEREKAREAAGKKRRRWPWLILLLVVAGAIGAAIWQRQSAKPESSPQGVASQDGAILLHPLDVTDVVRETLHDTLRITGTLQPHTQVQINSKVAGTVERVNVRLGDRVARGDVMLQIDPEVLANQLAQQQATMVAQQEQFALAETQAKRAAELSDRGVSASSALETANSNLEVQRANLAVQEAAVEAAEINLRDTEIRAPFDGIVASRDAEPGQTIASGTSLFELADMSAMNVSVNVPVSRTVNLKPGQSVNFSVEGLEGRSFTGKVEGVSPTTVAGSRNALVLVVVDNPDGILRGGMFATGDIRLETVPDVVAVPRATVRKDEKGSYVLKIQGDKLVRHAVETGRSWQGDAMITILSGLEAGDQVVSGRLPDLTDGMAVRVTEAL